MRSSLSAAVVGCLIIVAASASVASVSGTGAILLEFETSVRNAGMGETGVANFWGGDPGPWANPGLLGYSEGARYTSMESQLVPDLADDIWLKDEYVTLGLGGLGLFYAKGPVDGALLDMGVQTMTGEDGSSLGEFEVYQRAERMGAGVSVFRFLETLFGADAPALSRWVDVSAGFVLTDFEQELAPDPMIGGESFDHEGNCTSYGALVRVTPINTVGPTYASGPLGGVRLDLAYGMSLLNDTDDLLGLDHDDEIGDLFPRTYAKGWSVHAETGFPPALRSYFRNSNLGWLADSLTPLVSFGYAEQIREPGVVWHADPGEYVYEHDTSDLYDEDGWGWELTVANIWSWRKGHVTYNAGQVDGDTEGTSLGFRLGGLGGVRWDKATVPQATGLADVDRESFTVWVDLSRFLN